MAYEDVVARLQNNGRVDFAKAVGFKMYSVSPLFSSQRSRNYSDFRCVRKIAKSDF